MVRREELRLRALFRSAVFVTTAAAVAAYGGAVACSSSTSSNGGETGDASTGGGVDASSGNDSGGGGHDAATGGGDSGGGGKDSGSVSCDWGPVGLYDGGFPNEAGGYCEYGLHLPCGIPDGSAIYPPTCNFGLGDCAKLCTGAAAGYKDCHIAVGVGCALIDPDAGPDGGYYVPNPNVPMDVICGLCGGVGRRPSGLERAKLRRGRTALGDYFAQIAHLEAASVDAFQALGAELEAHGAPKTLVKLAGRCARDEVRHAKVTERIAKRHGGSPKSPRVRRRGVRTLGRIAMENAVEGCVRETFGAMVATWQAANARDAEIAKAMEAIAIDETRHAALAWEVAKWAEAKLGLKARARIAEKKRAAIEELKADMSRGLDPSLIAAAGVPSPADAARLIAVLEEKLWA